AGGFDNVDGGNGSDTVIAMADNTVIGLLSVTGVEVISAGGYSSVTISGSNLADTLDMSTATLVGLEAINGGAGDDTIIGSSDADTILGGAGNDLLEGGAGNDSLYGGDGNDTAYFAGELEDYSIVTTGGTLTVTDDEAGIDGDDGTDTIAGIEVLSFKNDQTVSVTSPIILDLDGNGITTVSSRDSDARFDLNGD